MIRREAESTLRRLADGFPVVVVTGPRQSGKTTLVRAVFPAKPYLTLEDLDVRRFATNDPRAFLAQFPKGAVLDEVQRVPSLPSYLQGIVDADDAAGRFILTGSEQSGLNSQVSQSLAGRAGLLDLLPFTSSELALADQLPVTLDDALYTGSYPPIYDRKLVPSDWYSAYVRTYVERDVRQLINVRDLSQFERFLRLCAGRTATLLNLSSLGDDVGVSHNTIRDWLSVLEASFVVFRLSPYHRNFSKRLVKTPKLHFVDVGLACWLLGITEPTHLHHHPLRGQLFESWVASELLKSRFNEGESQRLSFWRDRHGLEVDLLLERGPKVDPIEVKSGATISSDMFGGLARWSQIAGNAAGRAYVVYGGDRLERRTDMTVVPWRQVAEVAT